MVFYFLWALISAINWAHLQFISQLEMLSVQRFLLILMYKMHINCFCKTSGLFQRIRHTSCAFNGSGRMDGEAERKRDRILVYKYFLYQIRSLKGNRSDNATAAIRGHFLQLFFLQRPTISWNFFHKMLCLQICDQKDETMLTDDAVDCREKQRQ